MAPCLFFGFWGPRKLGSIHKGGCQVGRKRKGKTKKLGTYQLELSFGSYFAMDNNQGLERITGLKLVFSNGKNGFFPHHFELPYTRLFHILIVN